MKLLTILFNIFLVVVVISADDSVSDPNRGKQLAPESSLPSVVMDAAKSKTITPETPATTSDAPNHISTSPTTIIPTQNVISTVPTSNMPSPAPKVTTQPPTVAPTNPPPTPAPTAAPTNPPPKPAPTNPPPKPVPTAAPTNPPPKPAPTNPPPTPAPTNPPPKPAPTAAPTNPPPTPAPTNPPPKPAPTAAPTNPPPTPAPTNPPPTPAPTNPPPTVAPIPAEFYWNVSDSNGHNCILAKADIKLELSYQNKSSNKKAVEDFTIPHNASNSGDCGNVSQSLKIVFNKLNTISFVFKSNANEGYSLSEIKSNVSIGSGNETELISVDSNELNAFNTKRNTSYQCSWSEPATLKENDAGINSTKATLRVVLSNIHFEAYRNSSDNSFSNVYSCSMDSPDIVPIMVGIALGILVIVVLIAYIVGRRNSELQGYLSM